MTDRRVVVTGVGTLNASTVGGRDALAAALARGRSAIGPIRAFDAADLPSRLAAEVDDDSIAALVDPDAARRLSRICRLALGACLLAVQDAPTSTGDYLLPATLTNGGTFVLTNPETGIARVTVSGTWTNASPIGATIAVSSKKTKTPGRFVRGRIVEGDTFAYRFNVPDGTEFLVAELEWDNDWGAYPTNDIDLVLVPPTGAPNFAGATINAPERASIQNPVAGEWTAIVDGFSVLTKRGERFSLRLTTDGKLVKRR